MNEEKWTPSKIPRWEGLQEGKKLWTGNTDEEVCMLGEDSKFNIRHILFEVPQGFQNDHGQEAEFEA